MDVKTLKARVCQAVEEHKEEIMALGDSIFQEPELGYKEYKTAAKVKQFIEEKIGMPYEDGIALTGIIGKMSGRDHKANLAIMGELDAVVCPEHPYADPDTGAAHSCGHFAQVAATFGAALALKASGVMEELDGDIEFWGVPAEECVEIEWRNELRSKGTISFLGGKQEMIKLGYLDNVDLSLMIHSQPGSTCKTTGTSVGFVSKFVKYTGKEAHAGGAPHNGINALNAAQIGLMAIHANRETFRDEDTIRVHPIITKGGDLVNIVPSDVRIETYVRGARVEAILDASNKVNRSLEAGAYAVGAQCKITELPGYLPVLPYPPLAKLMCDNLGEIIGHDRVEQVAGSSGGSTDAGDISHLMPTVHAYIGGAKGGAHCPDYEIEDKEMAYITAAKALIMTAIDLLAEGAETGLEVKAGFTPALTKEDYLRDWGHL